MKKQKLFNNLIKICLPLFALTLVLGVALKSFMPNDLIANYNFLSTMTVNQRLTRGVNLLEFYKIEAQIGVIKRTVILDVVNVVLFVPLGILIAHFFNNKKILITGLTVFVFSLLIEVFQLVTVIGAFMLNDLIANTLGGFLGAIIYVAVTKNQKYKIYNLLLYIFIAIKPRLTLFNSFISLANKGVCSVIHKSCWMQLVTY